MQWRPSGSRIDPEPAQEVRCVRGAELEAPVTPAWSLLVVMSISNIHSWHNRKRLPVDQRRLWLAGLLPGVFSVCIAMETNWGSSQLQQRENQGEDQLINQASIQYSVLTTGGRQIHQISIVLMVLLLLLVLMLVFVSVLVQVPAQVLALVLALVLLHS